MYQRYQNQSFEVLAFPCLPYFVLQMFLTNCAGNQFGNQEPGTNEQIKHFARDEMNATFPLFSKINVNGPTAIPLYVYLKSIFSGEIEWNFTKFLIDRNGLVVARYHPQQNPLSFESDIVKLLQRQKQVRK